MTKITADEAPDRLVLDLDPNGPVELGELTGSFAALARLYERHYRRDGKPAPKLYITKLETGSIIAEVAPYIFLMGQAFNAMEVATVIADFTKRLRSGLQAFSDPAGISPGEVEKPSREDAADLREFIRPLTGRTGASLGLKHAKFRQRDGGRETVAEYVFDEAEINRAALNIQDSLNDSATAQVPLVEGAPSSETDGMRREVVLVFEQASRKPGKEKGRTGDRGIIAEVSPKSLPVYFKKRTQALKDQMVRGDTNPLTNNAFVVDVYVTRVGGEPKAYSVVELHEMLPLGDPSDT